MPYSLFQVDSVTDSIKTLVKKDPALLKQLEKKINEILQNPYGVGKWMRGKYGGVRETHICLTPSLGLHAKVPKREQPFYRK